MMFLLLSWFRNIFMSVVVSMSCPLVLKVFLMIIGAFVLPCSWLSLTNLWIVFSEPLVNQSFLLDGIDIHISNRRYLLLRELSVGQSSPMSLNSFHMPLIHYSYNILMFSQSIQISENPFVSLVNKDFLLFWCHFIKESHKEIDSTTINGLCECLASSNV